jgi:2'-5' RNA ligase
MLLFAEKKIIAHQLRDFRKWHRGIAHYGLWCLMVDDPAWQQAITLAQKHLAPFLHPGYRRQPHITLFPCGLLADDFFGKEMLTRQIQALTKAHLTPFRLELPGHLDSFATAPHLPVTDRDGGLAKIRAILAAVSAEDSPTPRYHPHITLGFYREVFAIDEISARLRAFHASPMTWTACSLCFCRFATADTQGPLETLACLKIGSKAGQG